MSKQYYQPAVRWRRIAEECAQLFEIKNQEYGNAIQSTGVLGATVELIGATARLSKMVLRNPTHGRDVIKNLRNNVLRDIVIYGVIAIMMVDQIMPDGSSGNWIGHSWEEMGEENDKPTTDF